MKHTIYVGAQFCGGSRGTGYITVLLLYLKMNVPADRAVGAQVYANAEDTVVALNIIGARDRRGRTGHKCMTARSGREGVLS